MLQRMREQVDIRLRIGHDGVNPEPHIVRAFLVARRARVRLAGARGRGRGDVRPRLISILVQ